MLQHCKEIEAAIIDFGDSFELLQSNIYYRKVMILDILQIGELAGHLTSDFKRKYDILPWQKMVKMRNIVAHHYELFDINYLWETVKNDIPILKSFCEKLILENNEA
jgi:uncharacterized protein with HEPN domain